MDVWVMDQPMLSSLLSIPEEMEKLLNAPTRTYVRDSKAVASTPSDVKELPESFVFVLDMPGLRSGDIKVQVEDGNVLSICGERKSDVSGSEVRYLRMERRASGKFMRKFTLPKNANTDSVSAAYQDGVLTVTVPKVPPPEPKKLKTVEISGEPRNFLWGRGLLVFSDY